MVIMISSIFLLFMEQISLFRMILETPLHMTTKQQSVEAAKELIRNGADYTIQNMKGEDGLYGFIDEKRKILLEHIPWEIKEPSED
jgi:hypothetical protein